MRERWRYLTWPPAILKVCFGGVGRLEVGRLGWEGWGIKVVVVVVNGCAGVVGGFGCASAGWATGVLCVSLRSGTVPMNF